MIKLSRTFILASAGLLALTSVAAAEEEGDWLPGDLSGNVAFYSDYDFRGFSQTSKNLALQGGIDWAHESGIYFGLWASTVDGTINNGGIEQDVYGGYAGEIAGFSYDIGAVFFYYPQSDEFNYWEFPISVGYDFDVASVSAGFIFSPEYFGDGQDEGYIFNGGVEVPIPLDLPGLSFTLDATVGYVLEDEFISSSDDDYVYWSTGLVIGLPKGLGIDLRGVGTDVGDEFENAENRFLAGLTFSF